MIGGLTFTTLHLAGLAFILGLVAGAISLILFIAAIGAKREGNGKGASKICLVAMVLGFAAVVGIAFALGVQNELDNSFFL